jgi:hypothetical protein
MAPTEPVPSILTTLKIQEVLSVLGDLFEMVVLLQLVLLIELRGRGLSDVKAAHARSYAGSGEEF